MVKDSFMVRNLYMHASFSFYFCHHMLIHLSGFQLATYLAVICRSGCLQISNDHVINHYLLNLLQVIALKKRNTQL